MKKAAILAVIMIVGIAAAQPAMAGVGGCRIQALCAPGPAGAQLSTPTTTKRITVIQSLADALPLPAGSLLRVLFEKPASKTTVPVPTVPDSTTYACRPRPGVGGCWL